MTEQAIAWQRSAPPQDGSVFYGHVYMPFRWKAYKPNSEQFRRGIKGRWQTMSEYGGWDNAKAPDEWAASEEVDRRLGLNEFARSPVSDNGEG